MQENKSTSKLVIEKLTNAKKTVSTMESCTGGEIANLITSIFLSMKKPYSVT